jgi:hypothetical protein
MSTGVLKRVELRIDHPVDRNDEFKAPRDRIRLVELPPRTCVMIDGDGAPEESAFAARMPGLYSTAYPLHFALKRRGINERVWPLEGLWWSTDSITNLDDVFGTTARTTWRWTLFICLPEQASQAEFDEALAVGRSKLAPEFASSLRIDSFEEGLAAQIMHFGPYSEERPTIEKLHAGIAAARLTPRGQHHEIYLGDPRRAAPEKLRTILRQPVSA